MRYQLGLILFLVLITFQVSWADPTTERWLTHPIDRIDHPRDGENLTLASNGQLHARIVLGSASDPVARFAAEELQKFLAQSIGQPVPLVDKPSSQGVNLMVGRSSWSKKIGLSVEQLPRDGFYIHVRDNNVFLLGRDDPSVDIHNVLEKGEWAQYFERGTLFAVYDFLERFVGVRFYFPGSLGTVVQSQKDLTLKRIELMERPDMTVRRTTLSSGQWYDPSLNAKQRRRQSNLNRYRMRFETQYLPSNHGVTRLGLLERFGKSHPEYFTLMSNGKRDNRSDIASIIHPGHLCYSSGIKQQIVADAMSFFKGEEAAVRGIISGHHRGQRSYAWSPAAFGWGIFNLMLTDGRRDCQCPDCQKHLNGSSQQVSNYLWQFFIDIATQVTKQLKQQRPESPTPIFTTTAYAYYKLTPNISLPENYLVQVATYGAWRKNDMNAAKQDKQLIADWTAKLGHRVWLWNYSCKCISGFDIKDVPNPTPRAIGRYYAQQAPQIFGALLQSETDRDIYAYLTRYVFYKVLWDAKTDVDQLLAEHHRLMFGKAADVMSQIFDQYENIWIDYIANRVVDTPVGPVAAPPTTNELWGKIYNQAVMDQLQRRYDKAIQLAKLDMKATQRIQYIHEQYQQPLAQARDKYFEQQRKLAGLHMYIKPLDTQAKPVIDGKLDDPAWSDSSVVQLRPFKHDRNVVPTTVMARRSSTHWYFAYNCIEPNRDQVQVTKRQPDDPKTWQDNCIELFINPSGDAVNYYQWMINSMGCMADLKAKKIGVKSQIDAAWNSHAQVATAQNDMGWSVEIAIPIESLGSVTPNATRVNFTRSRVLDSSAKAGTYYTWSPFINQYHDVEHFGNLLMQTLQQQSILIDGSFESKPSGRAIGKWYASAKLPDGQSWEVDTEQGVDGKQSLKLTANKDHPSLTLHQPLPQLKPNTHYLLSFKVKLQDIQSVGKRGGGVCLNIWSDHNHFFPKRIISMTGTKDWAMHHFEFVTGPQTNVQKKNAFIRVRILQAAGTVWFDDVCLIPLD